MLQRSLPFCRQKSSFVFRVVAVIVFWKKVTFKKILLSSRIKILFLVSIFVSCRVLFKSQHKFTVTSTGHVRICFFLGLSSDRVLLRCS